MRRPVIARCHSYLIIRLQRPAMQATGLRFKMSAVTVQPGVDLKSAFNGEISPGPFAECLELQDAVFADEHRSSGFDIFTIDGSVEVGATDSDQCRLFEKESGGGKMQFSSGLKSIVANQKIG